MSKLLEILLDALRKQAFSVMLLLAGCGGLWLMLDDAKRDAKATTTYLFTQIAELRNDISDCDKERAALQVEVTMLRERTNILAGIKPH